MSHWKKADVMAWVETRAQLDEDTCCLIWKRAVNGDGLPVASVDGVRARNVRRWLHEQLLGPADGMRLVLTCREPHCVQPAHFCLLLPGQVAVLSASEGRYVTPKRLASSRRNGRRGSKLTAADAEHVRSMRAEGKKLREIAEAFGMSISAASLICLGKSWKATAAGATVFGWGGAA